MLQLLGLGALLFVPSAHHRPSLRRRCRACVVAEVPLPESPKDVATQMSYAVQAALAAGKTELAISLPPGMRFGLFGDAGKQVIGTPGAAPSLAQAQRAEFEIVFLCAEMFRGECTCVFQSAAAVKAAEREFASKGLRPRIVPNVGKLAAKAAVGFGKQSTAGAADKSAVQAKVGGLSHLSQPLLLMNYYLLSYLRTHALKHQRTDTLHRAATLSQPVTLPLHYRYIAVALPLHYRYIAVASPVQVVILSQPSASDLKKLTRPEGGLVLLVNARKRPAQYEQVHSEQ